MNAFNPAHFRAQFPALADAGVYLDSAATALKPLAVIDASDQFYRLSAGNVHRSQFAAAQRLTERYEAAREHVAAYFQKSYFIPFLNSLTRFFDYPIYIFIYYYSSIFCWTYEMIHEY